MAATLRMQSRATRTMPLQREALELIVAHGGELRNVGSRQTGPFLVYALLRVWAGPRVVEFLLQHVPAGARYEDHTHCVDGLHTVRGCTPIHWSERGDTTRLLLRHGADVHARNGWDGTPLHTAVSNDSCDVDVVRALVEARADVNAVADGPGLTPLRMALAHSCDNGALEARVRLLVCTGADPCLRIGGSPSALHESATSVNYCVNCVTSSSSSHKSNGEVASMVSNLVVQERLNRQMMRAGAWLRRRHLVLVVQARSGAAAPAAGGGAAVETRAAAAL